MLQFQSVPDRAPQSQLGCGRQADFGIILVRSRWPTPLSVTFCGLSLMNKSAGCICGRSRSVGDTVLAGGTCQKNKTGSTTRRGCGEGGFLPRRKLHSSLQSHRKGAPGPVVRVCFISAQNKAASLSRAVSVDSDLFLGFLRSIFAGIKARAASSRHVLPRALAHLLTRALTRAPGRKHP